MQPLSRRHSTKTEAPANPLKFFADTAEIAEIRELAETGSRSNWIALKLGRTIEDVRRRAAEIDASLAGD